MSRNFISSAQFSELPGGSRRLSDGSEGPKSGYYVARDPDKDVHKGGSYEAKVRDVHPGDVQAHFDLVKDDGAMTARPEQHPDEVYQGTWPANGMRYLDVSDRFPASPNGLMHALQHGMANVQLAAWAAHSLHGEEWGPGDKREVTLTTSRGEGDDIEKLGHPEGVRMTANALHAQEARRAAAKSGKKFPTKNQRGSL